MKETVEQLPAWVIIGGWAVTVLVAYIGTRHAVNKHGDQEMHGIEQVRSELRLMREAQTASNQLAAEYAGVHTRRVDLLEGRMDRVENRVFQANGT